MVNLTIEACDELDGRKDGVAARTELCKLHFDLSSTIGESYECAASASSSPMCGSVTYLPKQKGKITKEGVEAAKTMLKGLHTTDGKRAYLYYQPSSTFDDAATAYDNETDTWGLDISSLSGEWVEKFLKLRDLGNIPTEEFKDVTYDTLKDWMELEWKRYEDVLQTTWPDLTPFKKAGGKLIHIHGETDPSIPSASSVHYYESVRKVTFGGSYNASVKEMDEFYRLFLVPSAQHCSPGTIQPGTWPQTALEQLNKWVESGDAPEYLNATVTTGNTKGENWNLCHYPLRPVHGDKPTDVKCVYDQESINTWQYEFDAYKPTLY